MDGLVASYDAPNHVARDAQLTIDRLDLLALLRGTPVSTVRPPLV
jgi:hypothetical protein